MDDDPFMYRGQDMRPVDQIIHQISIMALAVHHALQLAPQIREDLAMRLMEELLTGVPADELVHLVDIRQHTISWINDGAPKSGFLPPIQ